MLSSTGSNLNAFDLVSLSLAIVAVLFAIKQYIDACGVKRHAVLLDAQLTATPERVEDYQRKDVDAGHSTVPDNVPAICKLINDCTPSTTLRIMVDYIGYSLYSDRKGFDEYLKCLQSAISGGSKIQMLVFDYTRAKRAIRRQYPSISGETEKTRFADFFRRLGVSKATNEKGFYRSLFRAEEKLYEEIAGVEMRLLTEEPPALFWLKNNPNSIVFSFRDEFPGTGFSFQSEDSDLVGQFVAMFETHWKRAEEHWDCRW